MLGVAVFFIAPLLLAEEVENFLLAAGLFCGEGLDAFPVLEFLSFDPFKMVSDIVMFCNREN